MQDWLQQMLGRMFQPISQGDALRIASSVLAKNARDVSLIRQGTRPDKFCMYNEPHEPCWYIYAPWSDDKDVLAIRSSRVIVIGRQTGAVHYNGSAGDEG